MMRRFSLALPLAFGGVPLLAQNPVLGSIQVLGGSNVDRVHIPHGYQGKALAS